MKDDVGVPVGLNLDQGRARPGERVDESGFEIEASLGAGVTEAVHLGGGPEVEAVGGAEEVFEVAGVLGLGKEGEDAAAVVVDEDDGCRERVALDCKKAVEIVIEGEDVWDTM